MNGAAQARLLPVVVLALGLFALIKIGHVWIGFSAAGAAQSPSFAVPQAGAADANAAAPVMEKGEAAAPDLGPGDVERRILERLASRRAALDEREQALDTREAVIAAAEKQLTARVGDYERARAELQQLRDEQESQDNEEIKALVSAYERMKAKDAAVIFDALDKDILVPVAAGMRTQALAGVLAEMQPDKARALTRLLADRNKPDDATSP